jgi:hypothetical protein
MKFFPLLLGSLAASVVWGGASAQTSAYNSPPGYGTSINPPGAEGRSATLPRYHYHHSGTRGRLGRGANSCGEVVEADSGALRGSLSALASEAQFSPRPRVLEVTGVCKACAAG